MAIRDDVWPDLPLEKWRETYETLHLLSQMVGKLKLTHLPWINHSWHVTLNLTVRGLTTGPMPWISGFFQVDFDFIEHRILIGTSGGNVRNMPLKPRTVAATFGELTALCAEAGILVKIHEKPNEIDPAVPFSVDYEHSAYDPEYANRFWRILLQTERVFRLFRSRFIGKVSPVHFFWGSFDLAVTRFSGRKAPAHPGGIPNLPDWIAKEAYSHEVSSAGFWPGGGALPYPLFYSYAYPEPSGFREKPILPADAFYSSDFREYVLPYDAVRTAEDPDRVLLDFLQCTYEAAAEAGDWNRAELEREEKKSD